MRACRRGESGQVIVLIIIIIAILGGGWWLLRWNRDKRIKEAWAFANEATNRIVFQQDVRFLDIHLTPKARLNYPPSWRMRLMHNIREPGQISPGFDLKGETFFVQQFFEPSGRFLAHLTTATGPAVLEMHVSRPGVMWLIDDLNWTWQPPPTPTPTPFVMPTPAPSPTPSPKPSKRKR